MIDWLNEWIIELMIDWLIDYLNFFVCSGCSPRLRTIHILIGCRYYRIKVRLICSDADLIVPVDRPCVQVEGVDKFVGVDLEEPLPVALWAPSWHGPWQASGSCGAGGGNQQRIGGYWGSIQWFFCFVFVCSVLYWIECFFNWKFTITVYIVSYFIKW